MGFTIVFRKDTMDSIEFIVNKTSQENSNRKRFSCVFYLTDARIIE